MVHTYAPKINLEQNLIPFLIIINVLYLSILAFSFPFLSFPFCSVRFTRAAGRHVCRLLNLEVVVVGSKYAMYLLDTKVAYLT